MPTKMAFSRGSIVVIFVVFSVDFLIFNLSPISYFSEKYKN